MDSFEEDRKVALMSCIELVLIKKSNTNYHLVQTKLNDACNCDLTNCYDCGEELRDVLKDVYKENYSSVIGEIKLKSGYLLEEKDTSDFIKILES